MSRFTNKALFITGGTSGIATAVAFLASDDASYITGIELTVDSRRTQL